MNRIRNSRVDVPKALKVTHKNVRDRELGIWVAGSSGLT